MLYYVTVIGGVPYRLTYTEYRLMKAKWWTPPAANAVWVIKPKHTRRDCV